MTKEEIISYIMTPLKNMNITSINEVVITVDTIREKTNVEVSFPKHFKYYGAKVRHYPNKFIQYKQFLLINDIKEVQFDDFNDTLWKLINYLNNEKIAIRFSNEVCSIN